jgi:hypothetical protein
MNPSIGDPSLANGCKSADSAFGPVLFGVARSAKDLSSRVTEVRYLRIGAQASLRRTGPSRPLSAPEGLHVQGLDEKSRFAIPGPWCKIGRRSSREIASIDRSGMGNLALRLGKRWAKPAETRE